MNALTFSVNFVVIIFAGFSNVARATFTCTQQGAFADPDSTDCSGYILCDANLQQSSHQCYSDSYGATYFWPEKQICYSYYNCATKSLPNNDDTNPCEDPSTYYSSPNKYDTNCSSYVSCFPQYIRIDSNNEPVYMTLARKYDCPSGTSYRPDTYNCDQNYICTNYQCQREGYVPDPAASDCSTFIACRTFQESKLVPFVVTCPANTRFSPYMKKCDSLYTCDGRDPHKGVDPCNNYNWQNPVAVNNLQSNCKTYFKCQQQLNNYDYQNYDVIVKESCPSKTLYSPLLGKCYYNHVCNEGCSKDPCRNGDGLYVNWNTTNCETFLECRNYGQGVTYMPVINKNLCPDGSFFNPKISFCDRNYVCKAPKSNFCYTDVPTTTSAPTTTTTTPPPVA